jgi:hypothetical protein
VSGLGAQFEVQADLCNEASSCCASGTFTPTGTAFQVVFNGATCNNGTGGLENVGFTASSGTSATGTLASGASVSLTLVAPAEIVFSQGSNPAGAAANLPDECCSDCVQALNEPFRACSPTALFLRPWRCSRKPTQSRCDAREGYVRNSINTTGFPFVVSGCDLPGSFLSDADKFGYYPLGSCFAADHLGRGGYFRAFCSGGVPTLRRYQYSNCTGNSAQIQPEPGVCTSTIIRVSGIEDFFDNSAKLNAGIFTCSGSVPPDTTSAITTAAPTATPAPTSRPGAASSLAPMMFLLGLLVFLQ